MRGGKRKGRPREPREVKLTKKGKIRKKPKISEWIKAINYYGSIEVARQYYNKDTKTFQRVGPPSDKWRYE